MRNASRNLISLTVASVIAASGFSNVFAATGLEYEGYSLEDPYSIQLDCRYFINDIDNEYYVYSYTPTGTAHFNVTAESADGTSDPEVIVYDECWGERGTSNGSTVFNVTLSKEQETYFIVYDSNGGSLHDIYFTLSRTDSIIEQVEITVTEPAIGLMVDDCNDAVLDAYSASRCTFEQELWVHTNGVPVANPDMWPWSESEYLNDRFTLHPNEGYCFDITTQVRVNGREAGMSSFNTLDGSVSYGAGMCIPYKDYRVVYNICGNDGYASYIGEVYAGWMYVYDGDTGDGNTVASPGYFPGYRFVCWHCVNNDQNYTLGDVFDPETYSGVYTFNAMWEKYPVLHYDMMGHGDQIDDETTDLEHAPHQPAAPAENGYTFGGWYLDEACTQPANGLFTNVLSEDLTVYAKWTVATNPTTQPTPAATTPTGAPSTSPSPRPTTAPTAAPSAPRYSVGDFVERLYNYVLERQSDEAGKQMWIDSLTRGRDTKTGGDVAKGFLLSPEFINKGKTDEEFIRILYRVFFNREPDAAGLAGWLDALANGESRESVIDGFINSTEWANLCLLYGIKSGGTAEASITVEPNEQTIAFVRRLYRICLDREPDEEGLMAWANLLANQKESGTNVARCFIFSSEFMAHNYSDSEYITKLYQAILGREPDADGLQGWVNVLQSNEQNREQVFYGFANSDEFSIICAQYGIQRY